ncbi:MAG: tetratricopeptide repeat protein [Nibricoccus sp.]
MISRLIFSFFVAAAWAVASEHADPKASEAQHASDAQLSAHDENVGLASNDAPRTDNQAGEAASLIENKTEQAHASKSPTTPHKDGPSAPEKADAAEPKVTIHPPNAHQSATPEEIASLLRIGNAKLEQGDYVSSELAFRQVLAEKATPQQDHIALMGLARTHRKKMEFTKAAAIYDTLIKQSPEDPMLPTVYLEYGRTLRALGAYKSAIGRFYSVINTTLKLPEENPDAYRQLARTAQFEIAETYFQAGDYAEASRYFARLKLLDLAPEDRARAHFKSIYALTLLGEHEKAVAGFRSYLDQNPQDENVPEARYLLAVSLRVLGRYNESLATALELLRAEKKYVDSNPKRWAYWQRKTGNYLANQFFEQGDFSSALVIYQNLANLSPEPSWRLPVLYQVALCNERLHLMDRARECYETIIEGTRNAAKETPRRQELIDLFDMAEWRLLNLFWTQKTERQLTTLFPVDHERIANLTANEPPPNGSAEKSPQLVR